MVHVENASRRHTSRLPVRARVLPQVVHLEAVEVLEAAVREGHALRRSQLGLEDDLSGTTQAEEEWYKSGGTLDEVCTRTQSERS